MMTFSDLIRALPDMTHEQAKGLAVVMPVFMGADLHRRQDEMGMTRDRVQYVPLVDGRVLIRAAVMRAGIIGEPAFRDLWASVLRWFEEHPEAEMLATVLPFHEAVALIPEVAE